MLNIEHFCLLSLNENKVLYSKQLDFQMGHSTEHGIVQLVDRILESFEYNKYVLGVFIDLSRAFHTVKHSILLKKAEIIQCNHSWFKNYQIYTKQFIQINNEESIELDK